MRLCLFCETWKSGGIESFLYNVLTHADLKGLEVDVVAAQVGGSVFTEPLEALGVRFVELSGSPRKLRANHRRFRALLAERRYDAVHLNVFQGLSLYYGKLAAEAGVPVRIAHAHGTDLRKSAARWIKLMLHRWGRKRYTRYATALWGCSRQAGEFLFDRAALDRIGFRFVPNGIDVERFRYDPEVRARVREELGCGDRLVVGHVGRLDREKNQAFLLEVFAELRKARQDSLLLLVGDGPAREELEGQARRLDIYGCVRFYGTSDRVWELLQGMDVFVFPSRMEGLPFAVIEAQTAGLPVLCSDCIPREAHLTGQVSALPLDAGAARWAEKAAALETAHREAAAEKVRSAGFDMGDVAKQIVREWMWGSGGAG